MEAVAHFLFTNQWRDMHRNQLKRSWTYLSLSAAWVIGLNQKDLWENTYKLEILNAFFSKKCGVITTALILQSFLYHKVNKRWKYVQNFRSQFTWKKCAWEHWMELHRVKTYAQRLHNFELTAEGNEEFIQTVLAKNFFNEKKTKLLLVNGKTNLYSEKCFCDMNLENPWEAPWMRWIGVKLNLPKYNVIKLERTSEHCFLINTMTWNILSLNIFFRCHLAAFQPIKTIKIEFFALSKFFGGASWK